MKPEQAQRLRDILLMLGALIMFSSYLFGEALLWVGMVVTFSGLIPHFLYNKCPHCGHQLRPWTHKAPYCPSAASASTAGPSNAVFKKQQNPRPDEIHFSGSGVFD